MSAIAQRQEIVTVDYIGVSLELSISIPPYLLRRIDRDVITTFGIFTECLFVSRIIACVRFSVLFIIVSQKMILVA